MNHNDIICVLCLICKESSGKIEYLVENYQYSMKLNQSKACLQSFLNDGGNPCIILSGLNFLVLIVTRMRFSQILKIDLCRTFENNEFQFFRNKCQRLQIQLYELK
ncbi:Hypothetical_protein [Hexamita inflata]|uniref:Hypothetical_protein n=1 Tax=Hexamita inflata TaxID=28002 RepID=A0ABP1GSP4_9EUKA